MKRIRCTFIFAFIVSLLVMGPSVTMLQAAPPNLVNYQGNLTDTGGTPADGDFPMTFRIFDAATSGLLLYEETQTVTVTNGIYNVLIGAGTVTVGSFDPALFSAAQRWLEVKVGTEVLTPRQRIVSVAYALQAHEAAHAAQCQSCNSVACIDGDAHACYDGDPATRNVSPCQEGIRTCEGGVYGACAGEVLPTTETCDGIDDDCNGTIDDIVPGAPGCVQMYLDADGDGYGNPNYPGECLCSPPSGYADNNTDCLDSNVDVNPGQTAFFSTAYPKGLLASWDYNCDGNAEREYQSVTTQGVCGSCPSYAWLNQIPNCGFSGDLQHCAKFGIYCNIDSVAATTQRCR